MAFLKKLVLITAVLVVGLGYILYTPIPDGFSKPWLIQNIYSTKRLLNIVSEIGEFLGLAEYYKIKRAYGDYVGEERGHKLRVLDTHFDGVPVRIYTPKGVAANSPGFVYYHGGGWVIGSVKSYDKRVRRWAKALNMVLVSVDYRLAPEHTFPAGFDDCVAATKYFLKNAAKFGVDPNRIGIGGDSAGGHLSATVSMKLRDDNFPVRNKIQVLTVPVTQAVDFLTPSYQANADDGVLSLTDMERYWSLFLQGHMENGKAFAVNNHTSPALKKKLASSHMDVSKLPKEVISADYVQPKTDYGDEKLFNELEHLLLNPYVSPLLVDDLSGLPEAYVLTAQNDVLRDEGIWYAQRLKEAGVKVTHKNSDIGFHSLINQAAGTSIPEANELAEEIFQYIKLKLGRK